VVILTNVLPNTHNNNSTIMAAKGTWSYNWSFGNAVTVNSLVELNPSENWEKIKIYWIKVNGEYATDISIDNSHAGSCVHHQDFVFTWRGTKYRIFMRDLGWSMSTVRKGTKTEGHNFRYTFDIDDILKIDTQMEIQNDFVKTQIHSFLVNGEAASNTRIDKSHQGADKLEQHFLFDWGGSTHRLFWEKAIGSWNVVMERENHPATDADGGQDAHTKPTSGAGKGTGAGDGSSDGKVSGDVATLAIDNACVHVSYSMPADLQDDTTYPCTVVFKNKMSIPITDCIAYVDVDENSPFHSDVMTFCGVGDVNQVLLKFGDLSPGQTKRRGFKFAFPKLDKSMPARDFNGIFQLSPKFVVDFSRWGGASMNLKVKGR